jgi:hypothetical protein
MNTPWLNEEDHMTAVSQRRFVRSAPSRADKQRSIDLRVTRMTARDAAWWGRLKAPAHELRKN